MKYKVLPMRFLAGRVEYLRGHGMRLGGQALPQQRQFQLIATQIRQQIAKLEAIVIVDAEWRLAERQLTGEAAAQEQFRAEGICAGDRAA